MARVLIHVNQLKPVEEQAAAVVDSARDPREPVPSARPRRVLILPPPNAQLASSQDVDIAVTLNIPELENAEVGGVGVDRPQRPSTPVATPCAGCVYVFAPLVRPAALVRAMNRNWSASEAASSASAAIAAGPLPGAERKNPRSIC